MIGLRAANETHKFVYMRGDATRPPRRTSCTARCPRSSARRTTSRTAPSAPRPRRWAQASPRGSSATATTTSTRRCASSPGAATRWPPNRMVPNVIHRFGEILKRGTVIAVDPRLVERGGQGAGMAAAAAGNGRRTGRSDRPRDPRGGPLNRGVRGRLQGRQEPLRGRPGGGRGGLREKETHGVVKWWNLELKDRTPAWAEKETAIPAAQILRVARAMGKGGAEGRGVDGAWRGDAPRAAPTRDGGARAQRPAGLHRRRGRRLADRAACRSPSSRAPTSTWTSRPRPRARARSWTVAALSDMPAMMGAKPGSGVVTNNVANGMLKDPGAVKVFMASWSNFNFSCTGADRWDKAMAKVPFFVHMVTNPSGDDPVRRHRAARPPSTRPRAGRS